MQALGTAIVFRHFFVTAFPGVSDDFKEYFPGVGKHCTIGQIPPRSERTAWLRIIVGRKLLFLCKEVAFDAV